MCREVVAAGSSDDLFLNSLGSHANIDINTNLYFNGGEAIDGALGANVITGDPKFEFKSWISFPFSSNYYINWNASPARDAALSTIVPSVTDDIAGELRPDGSVEDVGAFESQH